MTEKKKFPRVCRNCRSVSHHDTRKCPTCGADVDHVREQFADDDPRLLHVDPENRHEVQRFVRLDEAELACGMLRANGIACELSPPVLPGVPGEIILWVNNEDAELAWALLADADREASQHKGDAA
jgi:hypothetical protein